jgi:threonine/homoserine/homoserine lactone efflux protein
MLLSLGAFTLAAALIVLLPGPDTLVVLRNLLRGGRSVAAQTVLGVLTGLMVWVVTASLGLSAVLRASHDGYLALRVAGALYLLYLGVQSLRSRGQQPASGERRRQGLIGAGYGAGLATDLLNPKVGVFFVTFLPGFVPSGHSVGWLSLLLGSIFVVLTAVYFAVLIAVSGRITHWLTTAHIRRRMDRVTGTVLIAFGIRLAVEN